VKYESCKKTQTNLEKEKDDLIDTISDIERICSNALDVEEFEDGSFDKVQALITEIKDLC
jgi:hypothetical protein